MKQLIRSTPFNVKNDLFDQKLINFRRLIILLFLIISLNLSPRILNLI